MKSYIKATNVNESNSGDQWGKSQITVPRTAGEGEVLEGEHSHSFRRCPKEQQRKRQYVKKEVGSKDVSLLCLFVSLKVEKLFFIQYKGIKSMRRERRHLPDRCP